MGGLGFWWVFLQFSKRFYVVNEVKFYAGANVGGAKAVYKMLEGTVVAAWKYNHIVDWDGSAKRELVETLARKETWIQIGHTMQKDWKHLQTGSAYEQGELVGEYGTEIASIVVPGAQAAKASWAARVARRTGQLAEAGGAAVVVEGGAVGASTQGINRIYSARELLRRAKDIGPYHNFPESLNKVIFENGTKTIIPNYYNVPKRGLTNTSIIYKYPGIINGKQGVFEIAVRPSLSGRTEVIIHRFFRPN